VQKYHGIYVLFAFIGCLFTGTLGYHLIEGWDLLESLYMTVITITTVGFHEENPLSPAGKVFTMCLIIVGFGICVFFLTNFTGLILRGEITNWIRRYIMNAKVELFEDHFILCGYGRMGKVVAEQLEKRKIPFVIIENDESKAPTLSDTIHPVVVGNAGDEETLKKAAINSAQGLISVVSSDAENAFTVMTAKRMKKELHIVSRCFNPLNVNKIKAAGADQVISPFQLSGHRITQAALNPTMVEFVSFIEDIEEGDIEMADIQVNSASKLVGEPLSSPLVNKVDVIIVGIKKDHGKFTYHPKADTIIEANDHLVAVGPKANIDRLADFSKG
jgi:voltage-gated potassium channel